MRVPLAWLREYVELPLNAQHVADMLAQIGFPVDAIQERPVLTGVVVGRIDRLERHPNADRLQVGRINVGNGAALTIATAATNVAAGQTIAVATIGARLPNITIERRKMRGIESEGMMISAEELALPADWFEDGIMQLDPSLQPGTDVVEHFRLNHAVLDVDVTSNRADAMSMIGLARELAAYQRVPLRLPSFAYPTGAGGPQPRITLETPDCRRFVAQCFTGVRVTDSPAWMRIRLALAGQRPINSIVDVSNYVMLEVGQPLHCYDDAHVPAHHLIVRAARSGERLLTLDGEQRTLNDDDLVIAGEHGALGLAGLMGGGMSEVGDATTAILLESANFTGARVRRMSARLGLRTEAGSRHERSLPLSFTDLGAQRAAQLLSEFGATPHAPQAAGMKPAEQPAISLDVRDVKRLLGYELGVQNAVEYLDALGFAARPLDRDRLDVTPPQWRPDVTEAADVIEEIARMAGYDRIEAIVPAVEHHDVESADYELESAIAETLSSLGYNEIATTALHGAQIFDRLRQAGLTPWHEPVEVRNPLSEDQRYLRFALIPAFLQYFSRFAEPMRVFEIGHTFYREDGRPLEAAMAAFAFTRVERDEPPWRDSAFQSLKSDAEALLHALTGRREFVYAADAKPGGHPGKSAALLIDGREVAFLCRIDPRLQAAFEVNLPVYACRISLERIPEYRRPLYRPPSKFPSTYRDIAVLCPIDLPADRVEAVLREAMGAIVTHVRTFDEYRGPQIAADKKSLAVRVTMQRSDATITDRQADDAVRDGLRELENRLGATLRG